MNGHNNEEIRLDLATIAKKKKMGTNYCIDTGWKIRNCIDGTNRWGKARYQ